MKLRKVKPYFEEFDNLINILEDQNENVSLGEQLAWIMGALPHYYANVRAAADALAATNSLTVRTFESLLLREEIQRQSYQQNQPQQQQRQSTPKSSALAAQSTNRDRNDVQCYRCKQNGHIGKFCPKYGDNSPNPRKPTKKTDSSGDTAEKKTPPTQNEKSHTPRAILAALPAKQLENVDENSFVLDSGATRHITNQEGGENVRKFPAPCKIDIADKNNKLEAPAVVDLPVCNNAGEELVIKDTLYAPNSPFNLLGVRPLVKKGYSVHFYEDRAEINDKSNETILTATVEDELYKIQFQTRNKDAAAYVTTPSEKVVLWHRRLGHTSPPDLPNLIDDPEIGTTRVSSNTCDICCRAKESKNSYTEQRRRAARTLEIVHVDLIGPLETSVNGEKYVVCFMDDFTHYTVTFALHNKSDIAQRFEEFEKAATAKFGCKISTLRCDNALEITSGRMRIYCDQVGIIQQPSEPYEHQHNGRIERFNRTLMERTRALLFEAKMTNKYWPYAMYAATYIINRSPTSALEDNITPFQKWFGFKPNLKKMKVYGTS